jgi:oxygen-dependent protoporphyrinogen oxidase
VIDVAVLGGGISGLCAAWRAMRSGRSVVLLEGDARVGGAIRTDDAGGTVFDRGPSSTLVKHESVRELVRELALEKLSPATRAHDRYILDQGALVPLPSGPLGFLGTPLFTFGDKVRLLGEPFRRAAPRDAEETIGDFARRRLGASFLANAVGPFVSGVWAGDPARLAVKYAAPAIWSLEQDHGSLIKGAFKKKNGPAPRGELTSFRGGMQALPDALARVLGERVQRGRRAVAVRREASGYRVEVAGGEALLASKVVFALPGHTVPEVLAPLGEAAQLLRELPYAHVATVLLVYRTEQLARVPSGFGFLKGLGETEHRLLGCVYTSALWPDRVGAGEVAVTAYYGGRRDPAVTELSPADLAALAHREVGSILRATGEPARTASAIHRPAIPQMEVGHGRFLDAARALEQKNSGLHFAGNWLRGVSVADCMDRALALPL